MLCGQTESVKTLEINNSRFFFSGRHPVIVRTPDERFTQAGVEDLDYNFSPNYVYPFGMGKSWVPPHVA
jgi:hypothetical protein